MVRLVLLDCSSPHGQATAVQTAKKEGAQLLTGGSKPPHLQKGFFIQPTVFTDVTPNMTIWNQEIFGPVLATTTFADEAEAVRVANQSEFGLGAAVVSADKQARNPPVVLDLLLGCCIESELCLAAA